MKTSLIITTYNRPDALSTVLRSVELQTRPPFAVIIADDGSRPGTTKVLSDWRHKLPITHSWLPDRSFRAARSRNLAISKAMDKADHIILIDGDCILPNQFVEHHQTLAKKGKIVAGGRALLSERATTELLRSEPFSTRFCFNQLKFLYLPGVKLLRDLRGSQWRSVRTCNMSVMTEDVVSAGGFDENYVGWGREDSDFVVRLIRSGCRIRSARFAACVLHLHHPEECRTRLSNNDAKFRNVLETPDELSPIKSILRNI